MKLALVHISDIHYKRNQPESVSLVLKSFLKDLAKQKEFYSEYRFMLAITGDIVYAGSENEDYENFIKEMEQELTNIGISREFRFMIPGNHDVDRNTILKELDKHQNQIEKVIQTEKDFNDFICANNNFGDKFENYQLFESDFIKNGLNFSNTGSGYQIDENISIYCLNTAITSLGGINKIPDERKLAVCTRDLITWCNQKKTNFNILLLHHPIYHLTKWSEKEVKSIIENNFTLCLSGHNHEQDILFNKISQKSIICSAPQLYTDKSDDLGYEIILIENEVLDKIIYRQYINGKFFNGSKFSENDDGIVLLQNGYEKMKKKKDKEILEQKLTNSLISFKNQPNIFIEPKLSISREFNDDDNLLEKVIKEPESYIIIAQPQFGLTCLSHYMRLQAYKNESFWIYLDANHQKARNVKSEIEEQLKSFDKIISEVKCIILDSWDSSIVDHQNILKILDSDYDNLPIIIMSSYSGFSYTSNFNFSKLKHTFSRLHLQALQREKIRNFVIEYNKIKNIAGEDEIVSKIVKDLEALNIHRTPLNCFTLLKVFEKDFNESLINRTKMIKAVLFILFTDIESFSYLTKKPDVDDVEYILGAFCKTLIENRTTKFDAVQFIKELEKTAEEKMLKVDVNTIVNILESNNILLRFHNNELEFKHTYWIYYFAGTFMSKDIKFMNFVLKDRYYVNFPEIIEFYTGVDGQRENAVQVLMNDTSELISIVNGKIGITEEFNPFEGIVWDPSEENINEIRKEISEIVQNSNLPSNIKDHHADTMYNSEAPYNQSIDKFLSDYSVMSLIQNIKASSRALRNSNYIKPELKIEMLSAILLGWEQLSRVIFWLSPALADIGQVSFDGFGLILGEEFTGSPMEKLKKIYLANPSNVVNYLKDDISSNKIGPVFYYKLNNNPSILQRHFISLFLIKERPDGWYKEMFEYINLLHINSFYIGNLFSALTGEMKNGYLSETEKGNIKNLMSIVNVKFDSAPKVKKKTISTSEVVNKKNELPIDKIYAPKRTYKFKKK